MHNKIKIPPNIKNNTNLRTVMSLMVGEAGVSGMSGNSVSLSSLFPADGGGAPNAAAGGDLLRALGLAVSIGKILLDEILGGLSGRGADAGVLGVEVRNVLTLTSEEEEDSEVPEIRKLETVVTACGD